MGNVEWLISLAGFIKRLDLASFPVGMLKNLMDEARFQEAIQRFDQVNAKDPHFVEIDGVKQPRELYYAIKLSQWVEHLAPQASEPLRLAARCQHIARWSIPRTFYSMDRAGYLKWRSELKQFHARKAGEILHEIGYSEFVIRRVQDLNLKKHFPRDPDSQILEDALCLLFLECQFADLLQKTEETKMVEILQKTWKKMSSKGQEEALKLPFSENENRLINMASKS